MSKKEIKPDRMRVLRDKLNQLTKQFNQIEFQKNEVMKEILIVSGQIKERKENL